MESPQEETGMENPSVSEGNLWARPKSQEPMTCDVGEVKRAEDLNTHQGRIFDYLPSKLAGIYRAAVTSVEKDHYEDLTLRLFQGNTANTEKLPKKKAPKTKAHTCKIGERAFK